jgi:hypothetical protein
MAKKPTSSRTLGIYRVKSTLRPVVCCAWLKWNTNGNPCVYYKGHLVMPLDEQEESEAEEEESEARGGGEGGVERGGRRREGGVQRGGREGVVRDFFSAKFNKP